MDVFIWGFQLEMDDRVILDKLTRKYNLTLGPYIRVTCYGHEHVRNGERIVKVPILQLKMMPTAFYILGWLIKTWYKSCENSRPCPRCRNLGHTVKNCKEEYKPRQATYADVVIGRPQEPAPVQVQDQDQIERSEEKKIDVVRETILEGEEGFQTPKKDD
ncbi:hypothetical protein ACJMK2_043743 [Sinanodonta woodiana]|uniref:CCHC-type domain-containing protein n=1 Tax=Sinanodonta woodiana TaxID=1069815 RepID=A0ABD3VXW0_SINWO